jgi:hypothetical protein
MATHSPIINYINEKWFFDLIKNCKKITQKYKDIENSNEKDFLFINSYLKLLPLYYACDYEKPKNFKQVNKIFSYKVDSDIPLTSDSDTLLIKDCNVEIHSKDSKIVDIFIVA